MTTNDPFGRRSNLAASDFLRRERDQMDAIQRALGPGEAVRKQLEALRSPIAQLGLMQSAGIFDQVVKAQKLREEQFKYINQMATPQWLSAVKDAATTLRLYDDKWSKQIRVLSKNFDTEIFSTVTKLTQNSGFVASAFAAAKWQSQLKSFAEQIEPNLSAFRMLTERSLSLELAMLHLSDQQRVAATQFLAEQSMEAQRLAEALAQSSAPDESAHLFIAFVSVLSSIFERFKDNTIEELRNVGLITLLLFAMQIMSLPQVQPDPQMSSQERQEYTELRSEIASLKDKMQAMVDADSSLNKSFTASLQRGELKRRANIRTAPRGDAPKIITAEPNTEIAIIRAQGRWKEIVFRDPLTDQLSQGWVYATLVDTFEAQ